MLNAILTVNETAKYVRRVVNPESNETRTWCEIAITTQESFKGFKRSADGTSKVEADVNSFSKPAAAIIAAFTSSDIITTLYTVAKGSDPEDPVTAAQLRAAEAMMMLKGSKILVGLDLKHAGDTIDDVVLEEDTLFKTIISVIPSIEFMTNVIGLIRNSESTRFLATVALDASKSDTEIAKNWIATRLKDAQLSVAAESATK